MSSVATPIAKRTLVDQVLARSLVNDVLLVTAGAALTALFAQLVIPLWPVPITGQTLAVLVVGASLGAVRGALSMVLYAVVGVLGLPVFTEASSGFGVLAGPTGGYIIGFVFAAWLTGLLAERAWERRFVKAALTFLAGTVVTFAFGLPWLAMSLGLDLSQTLAFGLYPFIIGGVVKAALAAGILPAAWKLAERRTKRS